MNLYLNNVINATRMITFNNVPTIVHVESEGTGTKAKLEITCNIGADAVSDYYFTINGIKVIGEQDIKNAVGNVFYVPIGLLTSDEYAYTSAYTLARALNNTQLANDYDIYVDNQRDRKKVIIEAKNFGSKYNFTNVETNAKFLKYVNIDGSSTDILNSTIVTLDVYADTNPNTQGDISGNERQLPHIATFQKRYYKDGISFNISSIMSDICKEGETVEYNVICNYINENTQMKEIGRLMHNYASNGYQVNLGLNYIKQVGNAYLAQNVGRGEERSTLNNTTLYYVDDITFSIYKGEKGAFNYMVKYLDSAMNEIKSVSLSHNCQKALNHITFTPDKGYYYVDVVLPQGTLRYCNIRPVKYANPSDVQTIYFYNSYGGVSFFSFTLKKEENRESEKILYKRNNFNYYNEGMKSYQKVYDIENKYEVTLQSHYMDKNGTYLMNDLNNTYTAWTFVEGKKYEIIIKSVDVEEQSNNGVYVAKVKFEYSLPDKW